MQDLTSFYTIVEEAIGKIGLDASKLRGNIPGRWHLKKGTADVIIDAFFHKQHKLAYFQVMAPIMKLPQSNVVSFTRDILTLNHSLFGAAFTLYKEIVWLKSARVIHGLDAQEAFNIITLVGNVADAYDDQFKKKYGKVRPVGFQIPNATD